MTANLVKLVEAEEKTHTHVDETSNTRIVLSLLALMIY